MDYEARAKAIRDYNQIMLEAKQLGRKEGRAESKTREIQILIADYSC
ncbi:MAG: hypothetical protein HFG49_07795 [Lachnospiraceae bacterium]|jgi:hypothetical protein|nr:hypothetical protein [Lachnospiraceae bacterium]